MRKLADSIYLENIQEVKSILENEPNLIDEKDEHGVLMALLAAKTGNLELVKYIVEYSRASMNIHDDNNKNMLHYAAMSGNVVGNVVQEAEAIKQKAETTYHSAEKLQKNVERFIV